MGKNTELKLVGQPIFSQELKLIDKWSFSKLVKGQNSDRYYKDFKSWDHLVQSALLKRPHSKKAFSTIATLFRIHLVSMLDVNELLQNSNRT
jgi:hypothetical protein